MNVYIKNVSKKSFRSASLLLDWRRARLLTESRSHKWPHVRIHITQPRFRQSTSGKYIRSSNFSELKSLIFQNLNLLLGSITSFLRRYNAWLVGIKRKLLVLAYTLHWFKKNVPDTRFRISIAMLDIAQQ